MAPDVLNSLQEADRGKIPGELITVGIQALDESGNGRKLGALLGAMKGEQVSRKNACMDVEQVLAIFGAGLSEYRPERRTGFHP